MYQNCEYLSHISIVFDVLPGEVTGELAQAVGMVSGRGAGTRTSYLCISPRPLCFCEFVKSYVFFV